ncbi:DUF1553 domain-containing protein [Negadavirga shengliensis]|uniref:DUF1553 domain-containing protein n=1 Tax=Negadavirga shengliensis TaxID=1389218 RepID=A0ABV9T5E5_9BACT
MKKYLFPAIAFVAVSSILYLVGHQREVDFSTEVKPILNKHCISCHGGVKKNAGFSLLFEEEALAPTESGVPAIIPGKAKASEFISRLTEDDPELRMPYNHPPLSKEQIQTLTKWVNQGAKWGKHWAYELPHDVEVPTSSITFRAGFSSGEERSPFLQNEIDHFIAKQLHSKELEPSPQADPKVLLRRVSLDLTGLPPSESLRQHWDTGKLTYEQVVDELLNDEGYGEKWASWWLDMARYADTKGYERDVSREIWAYRDWVIRALNRDMPFDQFTIEQLAGDLLPNPGLDQLTATAFHRNTMNNDEGGTEDEEFRVAAVIDRVNTTFEVWQSTTMACVQCHSHPYDPFKYEDYYQLMAFFNNTRDEDTHGEEPKLKFYDDDAAGEISKIKDWVTEYGSSKQAETYENFLLYQEPKYHAHDCEDFTNGELIDTKWLGLWDDGSCYLRGVHTGGAEYLYLNYWTGNDGNLMTIRNGGPEGEVLSRFTLNKTDGRVIKRIPFKKVEGRVDLYLHMENKSLAQQQTSSAINWFAFVPTLPGTAKDGYETVISQFDRLLNMPTPTVPIMVENPPFMKRETKVFERGNWLLLGDEVQPDVPDNLNSWDESWPKNRLGLAYWLTSKDNPLTARTMVNRIWAQLFGRGLVSTLEDMGTQSDTPSHKELLDWLALRLMHEHNWQLKPLIKDMVMSGTYRQSSISNPALYEKDPDNKWYARGPRFRLSAEQVRDQALAVSGLLSRKMYGKAVMPPQPENVWQTVYNGESWETSEGEDRYRRAIYTFLKRTSPYPSFITFDAGSREICTINRTITNTPLQSLVTMNDPVYQEAALHLARQMAKYNEKGTGKAIAYGYEKAVLSSINTEKLSRLEELYHFSKQDFEKDPEAMEKYLEMAGNDEKNLEMAALTVVATAILNLDEFLTKS